VYDRIDTFASQQVGQRAGFRQIQPVKREPSNVLFIPATLIIDDDYTEAAPFQ